MSTVIKFLKWVVKESAKCLVFFGVILFIIVAMCKTAPVLRKFFVPGSAAYNVLVICDIAENLVRDPVAFFNMVGHWRLHRGCVPSDVPFNRNPQYLDVSKSLLTPGLSVTREALGKDALQIVLPSGITPIFGEKVQSVVGTTDDGKSINGDPIRYFSKTGGLSYAATVPKEKSDGDIRAKDLRIFEKKEETGQWVELISRVISISLAVKLSNERSAGYLIVSVLKPGNVGIDREDTFSILLKPFP